MIVVVEHAVAVDTISLVILLSISGYLKLSLGLSSKLQSNKRLCHKNCPPFTFQNAFHDLWHVLFNEIIKDLLFTDLAYGIGTCSFAYDRTLNECDNLSMPT